MIVVRVGCRDDAPLIVDFQCRMALETEDVRLAPDVVAAGVQGVFDEPRRGTYYLAEVDGVVVGCLLTVPEWSDWRNGTVLWIHSVYVVPEARRKGVYRALYGNLRDRVASEDGLKGLRLYVDAENNKARAAYASLGMDGNHYQLFEWMPEG